MRGEIGAAGRIQHRGRAMAPHRLERVAAAARGVAVIDEQRSAAAGREPGAEAARQRLRRRPHLAMLPGAASGSATTAGAGSSAKASLPPAAATRRSCQPSGAFELADRQRVEELVGDH